MVVGSYASDTETARVPTPTYLPVEVNSFVGRSHDVAEVCGLLGGTRMLTLTGAGGCGKTRLAVRIATVLQGTRSIDVRFIDFSSINGASLVPEAVATVLGLVEQSGRPLHRGGGRCDLCAICTQ